MARQEPATGNGAPAQAPVIGSVEIDAHEILDGTEKVPLWRLVNVVHIRTKKSVITQEFLFRVGQRLNQALLDETERNLRALGIFTDVDITAHRSSADSVHLVVTTRDKWSTRLNTSYRVEGGVHNFGISLIEDNVLGFGKNIDLGFTQSSDRITRQILYNDRRFFGSRYALQFKYQNNSDFDSHRFELFRPFYAWDARWGFTAAYEKIDGVYRQFQNGELIGQPPLQEEAGQFILNLYRGDRIKRHLMFGATAVKSTIGETHRNLDLIGAGVGWMRRDYLEMQNVDRFEQTEDVPSGALAELALAYNYSTSRKKFDKPYFVARAIYSQADSTRPSFFLRTVFQGFYQHRKLRDSLFELEIKAFQRAGPNLFVGRLLYSRLDNFSIEKQLRLGEDTGLRGFRLRARTGTRLLLFNFEDRIRSNIKLFVFRLGLTGFVDVGHAWETEEPFRLSNLKTAVGLGLRIGNDRFAGTINRVDFAYNTVERKWRVSVSIGSYFSAFTNLDFLSTFRTSQLRADP